MHEITTVHICLRGALYWVVFYVQSLQWSNYCWTVSVPLGRENRKPPTEFHETQHYVPIGHDRKDQDRLK